MKISVVMAAFNAERYVAAAIESILAQTRKADEIIVIDDGSTDRTFEVLTRYEDNITFLLRQDNTGPAIALNRAISAASGDMLAFLDADDLWAEEKLSLQAHDLEKNPELDAVFGYIKQFISEDVPPEIARTYLVPDPQPGISKIGMLIRRAAFDRIGRFDDSTSVSEFAGWYARAQAMGIRVRVENQIVAFRRLHESNSGRLKRAEQQQETLFGLTLGFVLRRKKRP
jgi:glycosyltransferase involved in cell wall biosynthesis